MLYYTHIKEKDSEMNQEEINKEIIFICKQQEHATDAKYNKLQRRLNKLHREEEKLFQIKVEAFNNET